MILNHDRYVKIYTVQSSGIKIKISQRKNRFYFCF